MYIKKENLFKQFKKENYKYNMPYVKTVPTELILKTNLTSGATKLLMILMSHVGEGEEWSPSQNLLAYEMNRCVRTIQRYLKELKQKGFIEIIRRGKMITNVYNLSNLLNRVKQLKEKNGKIFKSVSNIKKSCNKHITTKKSTFCDYKQREYDLESIESKLLGWDKIQTE